MLEEFDEKFQFTLHPTAIILGSLNYRHDTPGRWNGVIKTPEVPRWLEHSLYTCVRGYG